MIKIAKKILGLICLLCLPLLWGCATDRYLRQLAEDDVYLTLIYQASLYEEAGDIPGAIDCYRRALAINPRSALLNMQLADAYYRLGDQRNAIRYGERAVALEPEEPDYRLVLGNAYILARRFDKAIIHYRRAHSLRPRQDVLRTLAELHEAIGSLDSSLAIYQNLLENRDDPFIRQKLASLLARRQRWEEARNQYRLLVEYDSTDVRHLVALGGLHQILNLSDSALFYFYRAEALEPANIQLKAHIFNLLSAKGDYPAAILVAQRILELDPTSIKMRFQLARLYTRLSQHHRAEAQYQAILEQDSSQVEALYSLARIKIDQRDFASGKEYLRKTLAKIPKLPEGWYLLGLCHIASDQPDSARWAFSRSKSYGNRQPSDYQMAQAYYVLEKHRQALPYFQKLYKRYKKLVPFLFQYGASLERSGDFEQAVGIFQQLIKLDPQHASALNYLGYMYAERGKNLAEAESLILRALDLEPDNPFFIDSRGWVYYMTGRYDKARADLERAVSLMPDDATLREHLGDAYRALGESGKALEQWRKALELEPGKPGIREKIDGLAP